MAVRRMLSKQVVESEKFLDLPINSQALYMHLVLNADDSGIIDCTKVILNMCHLRTKSLLTLLESGFLIQLSDSVYAITDWENQNKIQASRKQETLYLSDLERLEVQKNGRYRLKENVDKLSEENRQEADKLSQRIGSIREDRYRECKGEGNVDTQPRPSEPRRLIFGTCQNVRLSLDEYDDLKNKFPLDYERLINRLSSYMAESGKTYNNHFATLIRWGAEDAEKQQKQTQKKGGSFDWLRDAVLD